MRPLATSYWLLAGGIHEFKIQEFKIKAAGCWLLAGGIHEFKIQDKGCWPLAARSQLL